MKLDDDSDDFSVPNFGALLDRQILRIDSQSSLPIYRQLSNQLQQLIVELKLMPGMLLPSTRELSTALGVSRKTICRCYEELLSQGFLHTEVGVGTFVSRTMPKDVQGLAKNKVGYHLSQYADSLLLCPLEPSSQGDLPELHFGAPPPSQLPLKAWRQVLLKQVRNHDFNQFYYDTEPFGYLPLRSALASYLLRSRALQCDPEQIIVFSHALSPLRLFASMVVEEKDAVVIENPGFPFARRVFAGLGARLIPLPVDDDGLSIDELEALSEPPALVYVTPSHQDPTGVLMSLERRKRLLSWASSHNCLILEDDYDCEFRYNGPSLPALMALDEGQRVAYVGDTWKTLFPLVNIGYLVLPKGLVDVFMKAQSLSWTKASTSLPYFDQLALTEFISEGHLERHVRQTKSVYASRYRNLIVGLTRYFGDRVACAKDSGSMQLLVKFRLSVSDLHVLNTAKEAGLSVVTTQQYYHARSVESEFLVSFSTLEEAEMMQRLKLWSSLILKN